MNSYGRQNISEADIDSVVAVLRSDFLTQGPKVPEFEESICALVGCNYGIAMNSATSALHAACLALELGPGDLLWTTPNTFVASANCALYCGGSVDFIDIDIETFNIDLAALEEKLKKAEAVGALPKIVVPVHFGGNPCDMARLSALGRQYGFKIIEDASHAVGGSYDGHPIGNCRFSDITIFSFHPVKIITSGEGGLALTNDQILAKRLRAIRSHGVTRDPDDIGEVLDRQWYYEQQSLGFNYRMNDIEAALGLSQLNQLPCFIEQRNQLAKTYQSELAASTVSQQVVGQNDVSAWHLFVVRLTDCGEAQRNVIFNHMRNAGIGVNIHYIPVHLQPYYAELGFSLGDFPTVEQYYNQCITLPLHPGLTTTDIQFISRTLRELLP